LTRSPQRPRPVGLDGVRRNVRLADDGRWHWHWDPAFMPPAHEPEQRFEQRRLEEAAARIAIPTLIVRGLCSDVVSAAGVDDMLVRIPLAQVVEVATAGHMVAGDENDPFAAALAGFLDRLTYDALDGR